MAHKPINRFEDIKKLGAAYELELAEDNAFVEPLGRDQMRIKCTAPVVDLYEPKKQKKEEAESDTRGDSDDEIDREKKKKNKKSKKKKRGEVVSVKRETEKKNKPAKREEEREATAPNPTPVAAIATPAATQASVVDYDALAKAMLAAQVSVNNNVGGSNSAGGRGNRGPGMPGGGGAPNFANQGRGRPSYDSERSGAFPGACYTSGAAGHRSSECPNVRCYSCNGLGHVSTHCPQRRASSNISCQLCGTPGAEFNRYQNCALIRGSLGNDSAGVQAHPLPPASRQ